MTAHPSREELLHMARNNSIVEFYHHLRVSHPIDYDQLALTAKSLKTLNDDTRRTAVSYFKKVDDDSSEED